MRPLTMTRSSLLALKVLALTVLVAASATAAYAKWSSSRNPLKTLPSLGTPLPHFLFSTVHDTSVSSASLLGAPAVVVIWSTTCSASLQALAGVERLFADYSARGVRVLIVADDAPQRIRAFTDSARLEVPVATANGHAFRLADPSARLLFTATMALPSFLVTDSRGRLVLRTVGVAQHGSSVVDHPFGVIRAALDSLLRAP
jgi:peroxiredoxin